MSKESVTLYCREGGSDKVYNASIEEVPGGYEVHFSYGRRGAALSTGKKTTAPVSLVAAQKIYNKLVNEKSLKGYKPAGGTIQSIVVVEARDSGVRPQLLNEIEEESVDHLIECDHWCASEKFDGRRRMFLKSLASIAATNRKGLVIPIGQNFIDRLSTIMFPINIDSEDMGNYAMVFDLIEFTLSYRKRYEALQELFRTHTLGPEFKLVEVAWTKEEKRALYERLKRENAEGIVFKRVESLYVPGRPNSGGDQLKFKFCATATCQVEAVNDKRSIKLVVYDEEGQKVDVGNCTVYPNMDVPRLGELVEVRYLYYYENGSLFQPVLLGVREDLSIEDCKLSQLKRKKEVSQ
jgi:bifunctional non-homologous end joining protein LigD